MRTPYRPARRRRVLCVFPKYERSFGTFHHMYPFFGGRVRAFMPPQGLLVVAAYLPETWEVRFVDENAQPAGDDDLHWADVVLTSGMHVQRAHIEEITRRAHAQGRPVALGGPSVSACADLYPDVDLLHLGEIGDATDALIEHIDRFEGRPRSQLRFQTAARLPLTDFPMPAYHLVPLRRYFIASVQYSSGCPYTCEFCDIPALYGRNPRLKSVEQVLSELDAIVAGGAMSVYFVDDNFIGNQRAAVELLEGLVRWQERNGYPLRFACEATLNIARNERVLGLMRDACFDTVFCGIETPEPEALRSMSKKQNLRLPIVEAVQRLNAFGLEVVAGIIMGLDTDTAATSDAITAFVRESRIPVLTINLLYALPKTPLWARLQAEGRVVPDSGRQSNVAFKMGYEPTLASWRKCIAAAYQPAAIYQRFAHNVAHTFRRRRRVPAAARATPRNLVAAAAMLGRIGWRIGVRGDYRATFWPMALRCLRSGDLESLIHVACVSHHMIEFTRECTRGAGESAFYAPMAAPAGAAAAAAVTAGP